MVTAARPEASPINDADLLASMQIPATFIDRFFLTVNADRIRIAFGEHTAVGAHYSTAVAMSAESAVQLIELLGQFVWRLPPGTDRAGEANQTVPGDV